jgi:NAD dependent epimerase/dehydratase family enzyme
MHVILTGTTGLVGSSILDAILMSKDVTKISILSQKIVPMATNDPRVNVILHKGFAKYEPQFLNSSKEPME